MQNGRKTNMNTRQPETGSAICCPLKAVVIECRPPRTEGLSQRAKKL